jgi:hypothetical protein
MYTRCENHSEKHVPGRGKWGSGTTWDFGCLLLKGKGPSTHPQVSSPSVPRPRCAPKFYRPSDPVPMRVLYKQNFENVGHEVPCEWDCTMTNCLKRVRTELVRVGPSNLLRGESGLSPSYFFISLVLGPLNSLVWYVPSLRYARGVGCRIHCGVEVTESSTNKQLHHHQSRTKCTRCHRCCIIIRTPSWRARVAEGRSRDQHPDIASLRRKPELES